MRLLALSLSLAYSLACSAGGDPADGRTVRGAAPPRPRAAVQVSPAALSLVAGESRQLFATLRDAAGRTLDGRTVTWSSSDPASAAVSPSGVVTGVAAGTATVEASTEGGVGKASVTVEGAPTLRFTSLSGGGGNTCGIAEGGAAYCWGFNRHGQLGSGTLTEFEPNPRPTLVVGGHAFASINASWFHTCGMTKRGQSYCWGNNFFGQLGNGEKTTRWDGIPWPMQLPGKPEFSALRPSQWHTFTGDMQATDVDAQAVYNTTGSRLLEGREELHAEQLATDTLVIASINPTTPSGRLTRQFREFADIDGDGIVYPDEQRIMALLAFGAGNEIGAQPKRSYRLGIEVRF